MRGLRILLVDDNPINRDVGHDMLVTAGAEVELADDGRQGVEGTLQAARRAQRGFDAVLMDIQMPVLDGFGATAQLRSDPQNAGLIIIAMTAHALTGDRERSLQAGMDDHLTKPIDYTSLVNTLLHWLRPEQQGARSSREVMPAPVMPTLPDNALIAAPEALARINGNLKTYRQLVRLYLDQDRQFDPALAAARDAATQAAVLHRLKGSAATLGFKRLLALAITLEDRLRAGGTVDAAEWQALTATRDETRSAVLDLCAALDAALAPTTTPERVALSAAPSDTRDLVLEVREQLKRFSRPTPGQLADMLASLSVHHLDSTRFSERLAAFDLEGAGVALDELLKEL